MLSMLYCNEFKGVGMARLRLKDLAEARGLNISQLQHKTGLDIGMVRRYWHNEGTRGQLTEVNLEALDKIAEALNVQPGDLLTSSPERSRRSILELRGSARSYGNVLIVQPTSERNVTHGMGRGIERCNSWT